MRHKGSLSQTSKGRNQDLYENFCSLTKRHLNMYGRVCKTLRSEHREAVPSRGGGALRPKWPPSPAEMLRDNPRLGPKPLCPGLSACPPARDLPHKTLGKSPAVISDSHWEPVGAHSIL